MGVKAGNAGGQPCVIVLGGSFDPVHKAHVALARHFLDLFGADGLRVIPAGMPWQKSALRASGMQRAEMLRLAFAAAGLPAQIDLQEVQRDCASYSIDTLRAIRAEVGPQVSLVFVLGADQLQRFDTWRCWREIFELTHIVCASRPGFHLQPLQQGSAQLAQEFTVRSGSIEQIKTTSHGLTYLSGGLALDISATRIRHALQEIFMAGQEGEKNGCQLNGQHGIQQGGNLGDLLAPEVLDYIQLHHLYQK